MLVKYASKNATRQISRLGISIILVLNRFLTAPNINTHTAICIPANACFTTSNEEKLDKNVAMILMIKIDGVMTPSVEISAPRKPSIFPPMNVDKLTAIAPGVHWLIA